MSDIASSAAAAASELDALGLRYALVGGFAVSVRTEPRFTRDIDLVVAVEDDAVAEATTRSLLGCGFTVLATVEQDAVGRLATVRLADGDGYVIDLLFASSGIEGEVVAAAQRLEVLSGLVLPVATTGHLIALKLLARNDATRPQDVADLAGLIAAASDDDIATAGRAVDLITERGFHRDRDLRQALEQLVG